MTIIKEGRHALQGLQQGQVLEALGLAQRPSGFSVFLGALGTFALGALVGASVGLLSAPKPGRELRSKLRKRLGTEMSSSSSGSADHACPDGSFGSRGRARA